MGGQQGTRKTKETTTDSTPPPPPPEQSTPPPPPPKSKKPDSVFNQPSSPIPDYASIYAPITPATPSLFTGSNIYTLQNYQNLGYTNPSQLASASDIAADVTQGAGGFGDFIPQTSSTVKEQKFLRGQAYTQAETQVKLAQAEARSAQELADSAAQAAAVAEQEMRDVSQQVPISPQSTPLEATSTSQWSLEEATANMIDESKKSTSFWQGDTYVQKPPSTDLEMQLQLALSNLRINTSENRINDYTAQMARLNTIMDSEEAKIRSQPKRDNFSGYSEQFFMNESDIWRDAKFELGELKKIIAKEKAHLQSEEDKKDDWESISLTDITTAAFKAGISLDMKKNPMDAAFDQLTPATLGTMKYVEGDPDISDVLQTPDKKTGKPTSVFEGLKLPQHDYLGQFGFNAVNPVPAMSDLFGAKVPASEVEAFQLAQTAALRDDPSGGLLQQAEALEQSPTYTADAPEGVDKEAVLGELGAGVVDMSDAVTKDSVLHTPVVDTREFIKDDYGNDIKNPNWLRKMYPIPTAVEGERESAAGKVWDPYTGWVSDDYVYTSTASEAVQDPETGAWSTPTEKTVAPEGYEFNQAYWDEKNANAVPNKQGIKPILSVDSEGNEKWVYPIKGTYFRPTGGEDAKLERVQVGVSDKERDILAAGYAWQAKKAELNRLQKEKFDAIGKGEQSVGSFIKMMGGSGSTGSKALTKQYFEERGVSLEDSMASAFGKDVSKDTPKVKGIDVERTWGITDATGDQMTGLLTATQVAKNLQFGEDRMTQWGETEKFLIMPFKEEESEFPELDTRTTTFAPSEILDTREKITDTRVQIGTLEGGVLDLNEQIKNSEGELIDNPNYNMMIDNPKHGLEMDNPTYNKMIVNPEAGARVGKEVEAITEVSREDVLDKIEELTREGRMFGNWYMQPMPDDDSVALVPAVSGDPKFTESGELHPDGMATDSIIKMNEIEQDLISKMGEPGFSAIYLEPTTELVVVNTKTGAVVQNSKLNVDSDGNRFTEKSAQEVMDAFNAKDYTEGTASGAVWKAVYLTGSPHLDTADPIQRQKILDGMGTWIDSKPEDTRQEFGWWTTDFKSPDDFEMQVSSGYGWTPAGIAYLEEQGLIETRLEQAKKVSEMERQHRINKINEQATTAGWFGAPTPITPEPTTPVTPTEPESIVSYSIAGVPIIQTAEAEVQVGGGIGFGTAGFGGFGTAPAVATTTVTTGGDATVQGVGGIATQATVYMPTPEIKREGDYALFELAPMTTLFGTDLKWTAEGIHARDTMVLDEDPASETYGQMRPMIEQGLSFKEGVDKGYWLRSGFADEARYFISADLQVFGNIGRAVSQTGALGEDKYAIHEMSFFEQSVDAITQGLQWQMGWKVKDPDAIGGLVDPHTGELTKKFDERLGRPFGESLGIMGGKLEDDAKRFGSKYEVTQDAETGAWSEKLIGEESEGWGHAPEWYRETTKEDFSKFGGSIAGGAVTGGTGMGKDQFNLRALPWGTIAELPAEAAFFLVPLPARTQIAAALKIIPYLTSTTAKVILKGGGEGGVLGGLKAIGVKAAAAQEAAKVFAKDKQKYNNMVRDINASKKYEFDPKEIESIPLTKTYKKDFERLNVRPPLSASKKDQLAAAERFLTKAKAKQAAHPPPTYAETQAAARKTQILQKQAPHLVPPKDGSPVSQMPAQITKLSPKEKALEGIAKVAGWTPKTSRDTRIRGFRLAGLLYPNLQIRQGTVVKASALYQMMRNWTYGTRFGKGLDWVSQTHLAERLKGVGTHAEMEQARELLGMFKKQSLPDDDVVHDMATKSPLKEPSKRAQAQYDKQMEYLEVMTISKSPAQTKDNLAKLTYGVKNEKGELIREGADNYKHVSYGSLKKWQKKVIDQIYDEMIRQQRIPGIPAWKEGKAVELPRLLPKGEVAGFGDDISIDLATASGQQPIMGRFQVAALMESERVASQQPPRLTTGAGVSFYSTQTGERIPFISGGITQPPSGTFTPPKIPDIFTQAGEVATESEIIKGLMVGGGGLMPQGTKPAKALIGQLDLETGLSNVQQVMPKAWAEMVVATKKAETDAALTMVGYQGRKTSFDPNAQKLDGYIYSSLKQEGRFVQDYSLGVDVTLSGMKMRIVGETEADAADVYARIYPILAKYGIPHKIGTELPAHQKGKLFTLYMPDALMKDKKKLARFTSELNANMRGYEKTSSYGKTGTTPPKIRGDTALLDDEGTASKFIGYRWELNNKAVDKISEVKIKVPEKTIMVDKYDDYLTTLSATELKEHKRLIAFYYEQDKIANLKTMTKKQGGTGEWAGISHQDQWYPNVSGRGKSGEFSYAGDNVEHSGFKIHLVGYSQDDAAELFARTFPIMEKYGVVHKYAQNVARQIAGHGEGKMVTIYLPQSLRITTPKGKLFHGDLERVMQGYVKNKLTKPNSKFEHELSKNLTPTATTGKKFLEKTRPWTSIHWTPAEKAAWDSKGKFRVDADGNKIDLATWGTIPADKKLFDGVYYRFELVEDTATARANYHTPFVDSKGVHHNKAYQDGGTDMTNAMPIPTGVKDIYIPFAGKTKQVPKIIKAHTVTKKIITKGGMSPEDATKAYNKALRDGTWGSNHPLYRFPSDKTKVNKPLNDGGFLTPEVQEASSPWMAHVRYRHIQQTAAESRKVAKSAEKVAKAVVFTAYEKYVNRMLTFAPADMTTPVVTKFGQQVAKEAWEAPTEYVDDLITRQIGGWTPLGVKQTDLMDRMGIDRIPSGVTDVLGDMGIREQPSGISGITQTYSYGTSPTSKALGEVDSLVKKHSEVQAKIDKIEQSKRFNRPVDDWKNKLTKLYEERQNLINEWNNIYLARGHRGYIYSGLSGDVVSRKIPGTNKWQIEGNLKDGKGNDLSSFVIIKGDKRGDQTKFQVMTPEAATKENIAHAMDFMPIEANKADMALLLDGIRATSSQVGGQTQKNFADTEIGFIGQEGNVSLKAFLNWRGRGDRDITHSRELPYQNERIDLSKTTIFEVSNGVLGRRLTRIEDVEKILKNDDDDIMFQVNLHYEPQKKLTGLTDKTYNQLVDYLGLKDDEKAKILQDFAPELKGNSAIAQLEEYGTLGEMKKAGLDIDQFVYFREGGGTLYTKLESVNKKTEGDLEFLLNNFNKGVWAQKKESSLSENIGYKFRESLNRPTVDDSKFLAAKRQYKIMLGGVPVDKKNLLTGKWEEVIEGGLNYTITYSRGGRSFNFADGTVLREGRKHTKEEKKLLDIIVDAERFLKQAESKKALRDDRLWGTGLEQYARHYLDTAKAKDVAHSVTREELDNLGFYLSKNGKIRWRGKNKHGQSVGTKDENMKKLLEKHLDITREERDAPRAHIANISIEDVSSYGTYKLTDAQERYLKKYNIIAASQDLTLAERRTLIDFYGEARGSVNSRGLFTDRKDPFNPKTGEGGRLGAPSFTPGVEVIRLSAQRNVLKPTKDSDIHGNFYNIIQNYTNKNYVQPEWAPKSASTKVPATGSVSENEVVIEQFLNKENREILDIFRGRWRHQNKILTDDISMKVDQEIADLGSKLGLATHSLIGLGKETVALQKLIEIERAIFDDEGFDFLAMMPLSKLQLDRKVKVGGVGGFTTERTRLLQDWQWNLKMLNAAIKKKDTAEEKRKAAAVVMRSMEESVTTTKGNVVKFTPRQYNVKLMTVNDKAVVYMKHKRKMVYDAEGKNGIEVRRGDLDIEVNYGTVNPKYKEYNDTFQIFTQSKNDETAALNAIKKHRKPATQSADAYERAHKRAMKEGDMSALADDVLSKLDYTTRVFEFDDSGKMIGFNWVVDEKLMASRKQEYYSKKYTRSISGASSYSGAKKRANELNVEEKYRWGQSEYGMPVPPPQLSDDGTKLVSGEEQFGFGGVIDEVDFMDKINNQVHKRLGGKSKFESHFNVEIAHGQTVEKFFDLSVPDQKIVLAKFMDEHLDYIRPSGKRAKELKELNRRVSQTDENYLKQKQAGKEDETSPYGEQTYALRKWFQNQKGMRALLSLFGNKYNYSIRVTEKGKTPKWVSVGRGSPEQIMDRANDALKKAGNPSLTRDDVYAAKELDTLPKGTRMQHSQRIKKEPIGQDEFDPSLINVTALGTHGVTTIDGAHITTDIGNILNVWRTSVGSPKTQVGRGGGGMPEDLYNAMMAMDPTTSKPVFQRILGAKMGDPTKGIFNIETRKAAEMLGFVKSDAPSKAGEIRDKDALVMFLQKESNVNVKDLDDSRHLTTEIADEIQDLKFSVLGDGKHYTQSANGKKSKIWQELYGDGARSRKKIFDLEVRKDAALEKTTIDWDMVKKLQKEIWAEKARMKGKGYTVPDYDDAATTSNYASKGITKGFDPNKNQNLIAMIKLKGVDDWDAIARFKKPYNQLSGEQKKTLDHDVLKRKLAEAEEETEKYVEKKGIIDDALKSSKAQEFNLWQMTRQPKLGEKLKRVNKQLEDKKKAIEKIDKELAQKRLEQSGIQGKLDKQQDIMGMKFGQPDDIFTLEKVNLQGSQVGKFVEVDMQDVLNNPDAAWQLIHGLSLGAKHKTAMTSYRESQIYSVGQGGRRWMPEESVSSQRSFMSRFMPGGILEEPVAPRDKHKFLSLAVREDVLPHSDDTLRVAIWNIFHKKLPQTTYPRKVVQKVKGGLQEKFYRLTGQRYFKRKVDKHGREVYDKDGEEVYSYMGSNKQVFDMHSAGETGITPAHVRAVEDDMGISLDGYTDDILRLLQDADAPALKGKKVDGKTQIDSSTWHPSVYDTWKKALNAEKPFAHRIQKKLLDQRIVKVDGDGNYIFDRTSSTLAANILKKKESFVEKFIRRSRELYLGEKPQLESEAMGSIESITRQKLQNQLKIDISNDRIRAAEKLMKSKARTYDSPFSTNTMKLWDDYVKKGKKVVDSKGRTIKADEFGAKPPDGWLGSKQTVDAALLKEQIQKEMQDIIIEKRMLKMNTNIEESLLNDNPTVYADFLHNVKALPDDMKIKLFRTKEAATAWEDAAKERVLSKMSKEEREVMENKYWIEQEGKHDQILEPEKPTHEQIQEMIEARHKKEAEAKKVVMSQTLDQVNRNMTADVGGFSPFYDFLRYPAGTVMPFRLAGDPQGSFNYDWGTAAQQADDQLPTDVSTSVPTQPLGFVQTQPVIPAQFTSPSLFFTGLQTDVKKSGGKGLIPPIRTPFSGYSVGIQVPNIGENINLASKSIQGSMAGTTPALKVSTSTRLVQEQAQSMRQAQREVFDQAYRTKLRTRAVTITPKQTPRVPPAPPTFPGLLIPPWEAIRPRPPAKKKTHKKKARIWWDVPSQPLGEAWSPQEYIVFKGKQEPSRVKRKEKQKNLDFKKIATEDEQRMYWDDSVF